MPFYEASLGQGLRTLAVDSCRNAYFQRLHRENARYPGPGERGRANWGCSLGLDFALGLHGLLGPRLCAERADLQAGVVGKREPAHALHGQKRSPLCMGSGTELRLVALLGEPALLCFRLQRGGGGLHWLPRGLRLGLRCDPPLPRQCGALLRQRCPGPRYCRSLPVLARAPPRGHDRTLVHLLHGAACHGAGALPGPCLTAAACLLGCSRLRRTARESCLRPPAACAGLEAAIHAPRYLRHVPQEDGAVEAKYLGSEI
mmetsp:Transcript_130498/g.278851  ORF Transcript_130498/g.278851 Transcript_130498/m.278851 type:complete len:259 (-) Transcript_130498:138-914(-)